MIFGSRSAHVAQPLSENLRIRRAGAGFLEYLAAGGIERTWAVPLDGIRLGRRVALALARDDMQELRPSQLLHIAERGDERLDVVAVDGADVIESHLLEQRAGQHHALQMFLGAAGQFPHGRHLPQHFLAAFAQMRIHAARQRPRQIIRQRAHVLRNRHVVVVEDDEQVGRRRARVIERFERHAGGERAIADDGDRAAILSAFGGGDGHAERGADRRARVPDTEGVVLAFAARREWREAAVLLDGVQLIAAPGQYFVRIGLVADIPDQPVVGCIENVMKRHGEFDRAQARGKVAAAGRSRSGSKTAAALRPAPAIGSGQAAQVGGQLDGFEKRVVICRCGHLGAVYTAGRCCGQPAERSVAKWQRGCGDARPPVIVTLALCATDVAIVLSV